MRRLSKIKLSILQTACRFPYITNRTYFVEKRWLWNEGYLASYVKVINGESCIISGCYVITDKGRDALNG